MTDIPTAPDNKPSNLRDIIVNYHNRVCYNDKEFASRPGEVELLDEAVAAIKGLLPEKLPEQSPYKLLHTGFNAAIDTTLRNFSGQTEGEHHGDSNSPVESA